MARSSSSKALPDTSGTEVSGGNTLSGRHQISGPPGTPGGSFLLPLLSALRPKQWSKNLLVFAGLIFGRKLLVPSAVAESGAAFAIFCALSGAVYLIND